MSRYFFLLDRDVSKAGSLFPAKRRLTIADAGFPQNATDAKIVEKAWELECIIVTGNGEDFKREILKFQSRTAEKNCHELRGLLVLPSGFERQKRLLRDAESRLHLNNRRLSWKIVRDENLYVKLNSSGNSTIWRFPRCLYCQKLELK